MGREQDARNAWNGALEKLESDGPLLIYEEVHKHVARLLLARAELEFARDVLDDVPTQYREQPWWRALDRLHLALEEDRDDRLVFPANVARDERWKGPHLLTSTDTTHIAQWTPGRVVDLDMENVYLRIATLDRAGGPDVIAYRSIPHRKLEQTWNTTAKDLSRGAFVELLKYKDGKKKIALWPPATSPFHADLPKIIPPPDRYIRRASA
jgi:hypothetical protein